MPLTVLAAALVNEIAHFMYRYVIVLHRHMNSLESDRKAILIEGTPLGVPF